MFKNSTKSFLKCWIWGKIYGVLTGKMPNGKIQIYLDKNMHWQTY